MASCEPARRAAANLIDITLISGAISNAHRRSVWSVAAHCAKRALLRSPEPPAASTLTISNDDFRAKRALGLDNESLDPAGAEGGREEEKEAEIAPG